MAKRRIKTNLNLHIELLKMVYDHGVVEVDAIKEFIKANYSFNINTISTAYKKLCSSGFIQILTIGQTKFLKFNRDK